MRRVLFPFLLLFPLLSVAQNPAAPLPAKSGAENAAPPAPGERAAPAASGVTVTAEQWARPRSGEAILHLPGLAALIEAFDRDPAQRLAVRYAGGDDGSLWAEEMRSWLVALGVPSARIELVPGLPPALESEALSGTAAGAPVPHDSEPAARRPLPKELRLENRAPPQTDRLLLDLRRSPAR